VGIVKGEENLYREFSEIGLHFMANNFLQKSAVTTLCSGRPEQCWRVKARKAKRHQKPFFKKNSNGYPLLERVIEKAA